MQKKISGKILSFLLAALLLATAVTPAYATNGLLNTDLPTVYFRGNSEVIYNGEGEQVYPMSTGGDTIKAIAGRVLPLLLRGLVTNNFEPYYDAFEEEMIALYAESRLDENGDPQAGTTISADNLRLRETRQYEDKKEADGKYDIWSYTFPNDWRLDPLTTADLIDAYIDHVLAATGAPKVNLICKCLGGNLILAYLAKYGPDKINGIGFGSTVAFGSELVNDTFSGKIRIEPDGVERFVNDTYMDKLISADYDMVFDFVKESVALANDTGALGNATELFMKTLYARLYENLVPRIALANYATWPGYWAMVNADNYAYARDFLFGEPGSERYEQYAGLIKKLDAYDELVRQRIPEILQTALDAGVNLAITSKYGFQMPPVIEDNNVQGDVWTSARNSSLGATVMPIGETLSEREINWRKSHGQGKYLSPDLEIDAATCAFPDHVWFIKGAVHDDWTQEEDNILIRAFNFDGVATVDSFPDYPQFLVYDRATDTVSPMTAENADTETYAGQTDDGQRAPFRTLLQNMKSFFHWIRSLFALLKNLLSK